MYRVTSSLKFVGTDRVSLTGSDNRLLWQDRGLYTCHAQREFDSEESAMSLEINGVGRDWRLQICQVLTEHTCCGENQFFKLVVIIVMYNYHPQVSTRYLLISLPSVNLNVEHPIESQYIWVAEFPSMVSLSSDPAVPDSSLSPDPDLSSLPSIHSLTFLHLDLCALDLCVCIICFVGSWLWHKEVSYLP